jgi:hypothetical protein
MLQLKLIAERDHMDSTENIVVDTFHHALSTNHNDLFELYLSPLEKKILERKKRFGMAPIFQCTRCKLWVEILDQSISAIVVNHMPVLLLHHRQVNENLHFKLRTFYVEKKVLYIQINILISLSCLI